MRLINYVQELIAVRGTPKAKYWRPGLELSLRTKAGKHQWANAKAPDPDMYFSPNAIERFGSTGFNYQTGEIEWIGIDIDGPGHTKGTGNSSDDIAMLKQRLCEIPYVDIFSSTSGDGLHLHVRFESFVRASKKQMSKVGKLIVSRISADLDFNISPYVDIAGGNTWLFKI